MLPGKIYKIKKVKLKLTGGLELKTQMLMPQYKELLI
jgi:hypothetical protein